MFKILILLLGFFLFLFTLYFGYFNPHPRISTSSFLLFLGILIYFIAGKKSKIVSEESEKRKGLFLQALFFFLIFSGVIICTFGYYILFYLFLAIATGVICLQIQQYPSRWILPEIIFLFLAWWAMTYFSYPDLVGSDVFYHERWIIDSINAKKIITDAFYLHFPFYFLLLTILSSFLSMLSYKVLIFIVFSIVAALPIAYTSIYLSKRGYAKEGQIAALLLSVSVPYLYYATSSSPYALSLAYLSLLLFRDSSESKENIFILIILLLALIFTHPQTLLAYFILIGTLLVYKMIAKNKIFNTMNKLKIYAFLLIFSIVLIKFINIMIMPNFFFLRDLLINPLDAIKEFKFKTSNLSVSYAGYQSFSWDEIFFTLAFLSFLPLLTAGLVTWFRKKSSIPSILAIWTVPIAFIAFFSLALGISILVPQRWLSLLSLVGSGVCAVGILLLNKNLRPLIIILIAFLTFTFPLINFDAPLYSKSYAVRFTPLPSEIEVNKFAEEQTALFVTDPSNVELRSRKASVYFGNISLATLTYYEWGALPQVPQSGKPLILLREAVLSESTFRFDEKSGEGYPSVLSKDEQKELIKYLDNKNTIYANGRVEIYSL